MNAAGLSRRGCLLGAFCPVAGSHLAQGEAAQSGPSCVEITDAPTLTLSSAEEERHLIFMLLAMALVHDGWGVEHSRPEQLAAYAAVEPGRRFPNYAGHNVGAVLVDASSGVISFALNRNVELNSTLEHAEARATRNAIRIANAAAGPAGPERWSFGALLQGKRLYATLEPCAQCAGIMDLANIGAVIYGQDDPGQRGIVNVLYNLQRSGPGNAPLPIRASFTPWWERLATAYGRFAAEAAQGARTGLTSFLETVEAYLIYRDAAREFATIEVRDPDNAAALLGARAFRERWRSHVGEGVAPI
jgi:tRNA(Arg) A34 adenosine deaminase TadA